METSEEGVDTAWERQAHSKRCNLTDCTFLDLDSLLPEAHRVSPSPQCDWTARGKHRRREPLLVSGLVESNRPPEVGSGPLKFLYDPPPSPRLHSRWMLPPVARSPTLPSRVPRISTGRSADQPLQVLLWETFPGFVSSFVFASVFASVFHQKDKPNFALCLVCTSVPSIPGRAWAMATIYESTGVSKNAIL
ncbi:hypothetical protein CTAM01_15315 [Colletotrichum tamarilloi]|uniref:Uncharacterized protein n=1 Tax=Colletotrichum tamarilloi TaxID=1209934 RepID=A0ABQ9QLW5_9PEZI|nr:uncharacterized protein CTAM01_15315 [Colletotrichum tamarilloi]KAK1476834.1 hypothetical protein CTAM01_15315 [Colletotrichum tamarilloi]